MKCQSLVGGWGGGCGGCGGGGNIPRCRLLKYFSLKLKLLELDSGQCFFKSKTILNIYVCLV